VASLCERTPQSKTTDEISAIRAPTAPPPYIIRLNNELSFCVVRVLVESAVSACGTETRLSLSLLVPTASFANHYAAIVSRYAIFRRLVAAAQGIAEDAFRATGDPDAVIARSIARLVAIRRGLPQDLVSPAEWAASTQQALEEGRPVALLGHSTDVSRPEQVAWISSLWVQSMCDVPPDCAARPRAPPGSRPACSAAA
jgi:hypothetical protein